MTQTIAWDSALTEQLARDACFDCHSNETKWPWYAHVAPIAFLIVNHVNEGREEMNLSTGHDVEADEMVKPIRGGEMPLPVYLPLHPEANLTQEQEDALIAGILATFGEGSDS